MHALKEQERVSLMHMSKTKLIYSQYNLHALVVLTNTVYVITTNNIRGNKINETLSSLESGKVTENV